MSEGHVEEDPSHAAEQRRRGGASTPRIAGQPRPTSGQSGSSATGATGEDLAAAYLRERGYRILERNYRTRLGEIDLVCQLNNLLVFCEVKTRRSPDFGGPEGAFNARKARRISRAIDLYLSTHRAEQRAWRLDLVCVLLNQRGEKTDIRVYEGVGGDEVAGR